MWDMEPRKILVGIDAPPSEAALEYAVAEAQRRGCGIHLVHVARPAHGSEALDDIALVEGEFRETSRLALASAAGRAQELIDERAPDDDRLSVSTELTHGSVVAALQALSAHASVVVLEHEGMGPTGETATLSVTAGVAAVAHCPVVAVPDRWRPDARPTGLVVVGVEDPERDTALVEAAEREAGRRHALLEMVQAGDGRAPAEVLLEHVAEAELLVIGRHHRKHVVGASLGRTSRDVLRHCPAPVMVVDPVLGDRVPAPTQSSSTSTGQS